MSAPALSIAEILGHKPALTDLPTFGRMTGQAESTVYQLAAQGRLPMEVIRLGRKRYLRTVDVWRFLGLLSEENGAAREVESRASAEHDDARGVEPRASVERNTQSTSQ